MHRYGPERMNVARAPLLFLALDLPRPARPRRPGVLARELLDASRTDSRSLYTWRPAAPDLRLSSLEPLHVPTRRARAPVRRPAARVPDGRTLLFSRLGFASLRLLPSTPLAVDFVAALACCLTPWRSPWSGSLPSSPSWTALSNGEMSSREPTRPGQRLRDSGVRHLSSSAFADPS